MQTMKVTFDSRDLTEKLTTLLRLEGIEVDGDIVWGGEPGAPQAEVRIRIAPREEPDEENVPAPSAFDAVKHLELVVQRLSDKIDGLYENKASKATPSEPKDVHKNKGKKNEPSGRMAHIEKQLEEEADYVGHPLGSSVKKMSRSRSPNEFDEFPE